MNLKNTAHLQLKNAYNLVFLLIIVSKLFDSITCSNSTNESSSTDESNNQRFSLNLGKAFNSLLPNNNDEIIENKNAGHEKLNPSNFDDADENSTSTRLVPRDCTPRFFRVADTIYSYKPLPTPYIGPQFEGAESLTCHNLTGCIEDIPGVFNTDHLLKLSMSATFTLFNAETNKEFYSKYRKFYKINATHQNAEDLADELAFFKLEQHGRAIKFKIYTHIQLDPTTQKILKNVSFPLDLSQLDAIGFNSSIPTRFAIAGYFSSFNERWIEELIKNWIFLQPNTNIFKVTWHQFNQGVYLAASRKSRVFARQTAVLFYYLDQLYSINMKKLHFIGHSLGAHIVGNAGYDIYHDQNPHAFLDKKTGKRSKIARITGLDPAGPVFAPLKKSLKLDSDDADFVDVIHTHVGDELIKGAYGTTMPCGHVDYYANGHAQPGCILGFSEPKIDEFKLTIPEWAMCHHRRAYRYFIDIIRRTLRALPNESYLHEDNVGDHKAIMQKMPSAFAFYANKKELEELEWSPQLAMFSNKSLDGAKSPVMRRQMEFHTFAPEDAHLFTQSIDTNSKFYFRTRSNVPFFGANQYAIELKFDSTEAYQISIDFKINEIDLGNSKIYNPSHGYSTFLFLLHENTELELRKQIPKLSILWRPHSLGLLTENWLVLRGIRLHALESSDNLIVEYNLSNKTEFLKFVWYEFQNGTTIK